MHNETDMTYLSLAHLCGFEAENKQKSIDSVRFTAAIGSNNRRKGLKTISGTSDSDTGTGGSTETYFVERADFLSARVALEVNKNDFVNDQTLFRTLLSQCAKRVNLWQHLRDC